MSGGVVLPLQVAVNLLWCSPGRVGGSEEYLTRQLQGITALHNQAPNNLEIAITVYASEAFAHAHRVLAGSFMIRSPKWPVDSQALRIMTEHTWLAAATRDVDLVHHAGGTMPLMGAGLQMVTIHDLQYLTYPEYFSPVRLRYLRHMVPRSLARASMVLVPSHYVRTRILDMFGMEPERVRVAPHGIAPNPVDSAGSDVHDLRARYGLGDGPVYVYPAITHPHKNHRLILTAMSRHWHDPDLRLVLLGGQGAAEAEVAQMITSLGLSQRVVRPGRVPAADRDGLIALSDALVFPSRYEGFGAPLIEAMALGTPVAACDLTATSEVVGEAGWLLPDDPDAWADLPSLIRVDGQAKISAGLIRSREFSLENSARALLDAYQSTSDLGSVTRGTQK